GLVGDTLLVEPLREAVPREAQIGGERDAAVGVAVARVGERAERTDGAPFAALPADLAERAFGECGAPAVCPGCDVVRDDPGADALPFEDRLDQLAEPGRDDQRCVLVDELAEARADAHVLDEPVAHLLERRRDRRHLGRDHLVEGQRLPELVLERVEHAEVAEALDRHVQPVPFRDRAVPIEDQCVFRQAGFGRSRIPRLDPRPRRGKSLKAPAPAVATTSLWRPLAILHQPAGSDQPPSITSVCPRIISASGEQRNETTPATSSGVTSLPAGLPAPDASISSRFGKCSSAPVSTTPAETALTRTPSGASSTAR